MRYVALALATLFAVPAMAQKDQGHITPSVATLALDNVALNASAATRTVTAVLTNTNVATTGRPLYSKLILTVDFTYNAATTVTAQFSCSLDGTNYGRRTSSSTAAGATTITAETGTYTTGAASILLNLEYDVRGCKAVKVLLGGAGAGASDLVDATWVAVSGS